MYQSLYQGLCQIYIKNVSNLYNKNIFDTFKVLAIVYYATIFFITL